MTLRKSWTTSSKKKKFKEDVFNSNKKIIQKFRREAVSELGRSLKNLISFRFNIPVASPDIKKYATNEERENINMLTNQNKKRLQIHLNDLQDQFNRKKKTSIKEDDGDDQEIRKIKTTIKDLVEPNAKNINHVMSLMNQYANQ